MYLKTDQVGQAAALLTCTEEYSVGLLTRTLTALTIPQSLQAVPEIRPRLLFPHAFHIMMIIQSPDSVWSYGW